MGVEMSHMKLSVQLKQDKLYYGVGSHEQILMADSEH